MHKIIASALLALSCSAGSALAADTPASHRPDKPVPAMIMGGSIKAEAEVVAVDMKTRKITLKNEEGAVQEIVAGKEMRNLPQVRVGDRVVAEYDQILAIKLKKGSGIRVTEEREDGARAALGEKPGAMAIKETHFVADIIALNVKKGVITIKGAKGRIFDLKIKDKATLADIKVGDQVEGVYDQIVSLLVLPSAGK